MGKSGYGGNAVVGGVASKGGGDYSGNPADGGLVLEVKGVG